MLFLLLLHECDCCVQEQRAGEPWRMARVETVAHRQTGRAAGGQTSAQPGARARRLHTALSTAESIYRRSAQLRYGLAQSKS